MFETVLWIRNDLFRIQLRFFRVPDPDPTYLHILFGHICKLLKKHFKFNQKEESTGRYQLRYRYHVSIIFYLTIQFYSTHSPKFTGLKYFSFFYIIYLPFHVCLIRIGNNKSGSKTLVWHIFCINPALLSEYRYGIL